ncbi:hypothetical protein HDV03_001830 [Kappamyces sp. JEL0829]|nr:hypothetical protein HDV03_001830 [Kappamyces sp. JEL0829]
MLTRTPWTVVGAGPAGIAAVGRLLDNGVNGHHIAWIDPYFSVGLLGRKWQSVSSNTTVKLFTDFLEASPAFGYSSCPQRQRYTLASLPPSETCQLKHIVDPLTWVSGHLKSQVQPLQDSVAQVQRSADGHDGWVVSTESGRVIHSPQVVLAIGSKPREAVPPSGCPAPPVIPLEQALQREALVTHCDAQDVVAVFGSSHSAIMIVRDLLELTPVKKVINFYRQPLLYAEYLPDGRIVRDSTGLKGKTAEWARLNLSRPSFHTASGRLERYVSDDNHLQTHLPKATKAIYAIGFDRQDFTVVGQGMENALSKYDPATGRIAKGLYGVGIAFPELGPDAVGTMELQVGLWKFMRYLTRITPQWIALP